MLKILINSSLFSFVHDTKLIDFHWKFNYSNFKKFNKKIILKNDSACCYSNVLSICFVKTLDCLRNVFFNKNKVHMFLLTLNQLSFISNFFFKLFMSSTINYLININLTHVFTFISKRSSFVLPVIKPFTNYLTIYCSGKIIYFHKWIKRLQFLNVTFFEKLSISRRS